MIIVDPSFAAQDPGTHRHSDAGHAQGTQQERTGQDKSVS
jgi:hypothetical protein